MQLLAEPIETAHQSLQDRISYLEATIAQLKEENAAMAATQAHFIENQEIQLKLIKQLRERAMKPANGTKTIARIAKIDEILKSRGPTTLKELERILGIDRATMTRLLGKLDMRRYDLHARPGDEREKVLRLKAQIR
jgi:tRNA U34 5-carboxymethylaminomethyl modifying enzyme MnmG/GidA